MEDKVLHEHMGFKGRERERERERELSPGRHVRTDDNTVLVVPQSVCILKSLPLLHLCMDAKHLKYSKEYTMEGRSEG